MMKTKIVEIRDDATCIIAIATLIDSDGTREYKLLRRAGYSVSDPKLVILTKLENCESNYDPYNWSDRTMLTAHRFIASNWNDIPNGSIIDVRFILGESNKIADSDVGW